MTAKKKTSKSEPRKKPKPREAPRQGSAQKSKGKPRRADSASKPAPAREKRPSTPGPRPGGLPASKAHRAQLRAAEKGAKVRREGPHPVLSGKPPKVPTRRIHPAELDRIRSLLSQKRAVLTQHLETELVELEKPEKKHRTDLEEIASDTHETDSVCEIMGIESNQIEQIERALNKIDNGTYGICEDCGEEIPIARLEALPFATQCIACKRRQEIAGQISSAADSSSRS